MSFGVVGHVARHKRAEELAKAVGGFAAIDDGTLGCDDNHIGVLERMEHMPTTWSVVLEDDAVCDGLPEQLRHCLPFAPSGVVSLYLGRQRPPQYQNSIAAATTEADAADASWIVGSRLFHAVGYAVKTSLLPSLLDFITPLPIDEHISAWAQLNGHVVSYTWPSLVEHADIPTVVIHRDGQPRLPGRVAWRHGTRETWTTRSVAIWN